MEISKVQIKNFLSISSVELAPGRVNQIIGRNGQGKTSILKALEFAIKGAADGSLVKFGEESAEVIVELSDQTNIRRRVTTDGKQFLDVKREGFAAPKPQAFLDGLFAEYSFNPLEVLDPKKRTDSILSSITLSLSPELLAGELGVDQDKLPPLEYQQHGLKVIDQAHRYYYQRRSEANKDALDKKTRFLTYQKDLPVDPPKPLSTKAELQKVVEHWGTEVGDCERDIHTCKTNYDNALKAYEADKAKVEKYETALNGIDAEIEDFTTQLNDIQQKIAAANGRKEAGAKFVTDARAALMAPTQEMNTTGERLLAEARLKLEKYKGEFAQFSAIEAVEKQKQMVENLEKDYQTAQAFAESLDQKVIALAGPIKAKLMESVEMPLKGLEYKDGVFLLNGFAVENLSGADSIKLAIGVARKLSKKTKLICIDGAEALDEQTYKALREEVEGDGYTYFLTRVGEAFETTSEGDTVVTMDKGEARV